MNDWLLFVGPNKTGTSWIDHVLRSADGVCLPSMVKETFFFDRNFARGAKWYFRHFQDGPGLRVEVGPTYFFAKDAPARVLDTIPNARIIVTLRDPVARAVLHYLNFKRCGRADGDIADAIKRFPMIAAHSLYAARLETWFRTFGKSRVQVAFYEEVIGQPARLFEFVPEATPKKRAPDLTRQVNAATLPRAHVLGRVGRRVASALRGADMHALVAIAKRLGLKRVFFSGGSVPKLEDLAPALRAWAPAFAEDRELLNRMLGRFPPWG